MAEPAVTPPRRRFASQHAMLLVVDMQERLLPAIAEPAEVLARVLDLVAGAALLGVPTLATEQYPRGLGPTVAALAGRLPDRVSKQAFSALGAPAVADALADRPGSDVLVVGLEAHVCVAQTVLDLLDRGHRVQVAADAVGSRSPLDRELALRRLERAGAVVTTAEAALFEWLGTADHPQFRAISALVKQRGASP